MRQEYPGIKNKNIYFFKRESLYLKPSIKLHPSYMLSNFSVDQVSEWVKGALHPSIQ